MDTGNRALRNGILAAEVVEITGGSCEQVTNGNLAKILFSNLAAESWIGIQEL